MIVMHMINWLLMLALGAGAGWLAWSYDPARGMRGAILGGTLAAGLVVLGICSRDRLSAGRKPRFSLVMACALASGYLAGWAQNRYLAGLSPTWFQRVWLPLGLPTLTAGLLYGLALHLAYHARWWLARWPGTSFLAVVSAGLLVTGLQWQRLAGGPPLDTASLAFALVFGALPVWLLWTAAVTLCDPALSNERWMGRRRFLIFCDRRERRDAWGPDGSLVSPELASDSDEPAVDGDSGEARSEAPVDDLEDDLQLRPVGDRHQAPPAHSHKGADSDNTSASNAAAAKPADSVEDGATGEAESPPTGSASRHA